LASVVMVVQTMTVLLALELVGFEI